MAKVNVKEIKERVKKINDAWAEGAPDVEFGGVTRADFEAEIEAGENLEQELADLEAQAEMKRAQIESKYSNTNGLSVRVVNGVRGDFNFGPDSPLYGAMGFVRTSDRASGLTRKSKNPAA